MESHFLKHLQIICQASELQIQDATQTIKPDHHISICPQYSLGCDPYGTPDELAKSSWDPKFKFQRVGGRDGTFVYKWTQPQSHKTKTEHSSWSDGWWVFSDDYNEYQNYDIKGIYIWSAR